MPKAKRQTKSGFDNKLLRIIRSDRFFIGVIIVSIIQGLWYALTFQPTIFDEQVHIGFINIYSHQFSPFISKQLPYMDVLGDVTRTSAYLYYYLISWPLRLFSVFTDNPQAKIIFLRLINIALFAAGLIIYRKLFLKTGASKLAAHISLLFLILIPAIAPLGGAVNYDNAIFPLSGLILLLALEIIQDKEVNFMRLSSFTIVALLGSIMKFEFLALAVPLAIYVFYSLWTKHKTKLLPKILDSFNKISSLAVKIILVVVLAISIGLFIERPVYNVVKYHNVSPSCLSLHSEERCLMNYTALRDAQALAKKPANFEAVNPFNYILQMWLPGMITTQTILLSSRQPALPILRLFYYLAALGGAALILVYLRDFLKNKAYKMLIIIMSIYTFILAASLYGSYIKLGLPVAITSRYLLPVMPIFILFVVLALKQILANKTRLAVILLLASLLIMSQGGGIITYIVTNNKDFYWHNTGVEKTNDFLKSVTRPIIIKRSTF